MKIYKTAEALENYLRASWSKNTEIGFIPTMGALHQGHLSLVRRAEKDGNLVVCSIFVNPTQFNNADDLAKYPKPVEEDIDLLEAEGCDVLFLPSEEEIYPLGYNAEKYDLGNLETVLEGAFRPGHFQGVCQVVDRLLQIVRPQRMYLGQKDYQQCMVLQKLVDITNSPVKIEIVPTIREKDGLALSSRNRRLNDEAINKAPLIYKALTMVAESKNVPLPEALLEARTLLSDNGFIVDYIEVADAETLKVLSEWNHGPKVVLAAAIIDDVRLIDNLVMDGHKAQGTRYTVQGAG